MKKVMTYGGFEILNGGDIELFKEAKRLGDYLLIILLDDDLAVFERTVVHRKEILEAIRYVDEVIIQKKEQSLEQMIKDYEIDLVLVKK